MSDVFREVDEDLRHDRLMGLWQRYGIYVISIVLAIVLGVAGRALWNNYVTTKQTAESNRYDQAITLISSGDTAGAISLFEGISNDTSSGYGVISQFQVASQHLKNGDKPAALSVYDQLKNDGAVDERLKGLAILLGGITALDIESADEVRGRISPLAIYGDTWYFSAQEILALIAVREGDNESAISIYSNLSNDQDTPAGVRQRAGEILSVIENADLGDSQ